MTAPHNTRQVPPAKEWFAIANHFCSRVPATAKYAKLYPDYDDAVGYALLGLASGAKAFDPTRGFAFLTLAWWHVRQQLQNGLPHRQLVGAAGLAPEDSQDLLNHVPGREPEPGVSYWDEIPPGLLSPRELSVLRLRLAEGATLQTASAALGISKERARQIYNKAVHKLRFKQSKPVESETIRQAVAGRLRKLFADGLNVTEAARVLGVTTSAVYSAARRAGLKPDPVLRRCRQLRDLRECLESGYALAECAEELGVSAYRAETLARELEASGYEPAIRFMQRVRYARRTARLERDREQSPTQPPKRKAVPCAG